MILGVHMKFTEEQQYIINHRGGEMLVSAAAGSGKTAVLVERIIQMILSKDQPISIDKILVVTFTKAAAAEMKERITMALEEAVISDPENDHLRQQMILLSNAKITTIHSFCLSVIRDHFDQIDLEPDFRVADETEIKLLQESVMDECIEVAYESGDKAFIELVEWYAGGKHDRQLTSMIKQLSHIALSMPYPEPWLKEHLISNIGLSDKLQSILFDVVIDDMNYVNGQLEKLGRLIHSPNGPYIYQPVYESYKTFVDELLGLNVNDIEGLFQIFSGFQKMKLSSVKKEMDLALREEAKSIIDEIHKIIPKLQQTYFQTEYGIVVDDHEALRNVYTGLYNLVMSYHRLFRQEKRKRKIIDFSDIEHMALSLLTTYDEEQNKYVPSDIAYTYDFDEIMVDEYQDSSLVQEAILKSVSSEKTGRPNMFMVGDVKQSIYKFRMAKPELFLGKYESYKAGGLYKKCHLTKNFRSRQEVIHGVNHVFENLMIKAFGGVDYDDKTRLYQGFPYEDKPCQYKAEYLLIERQAFDETDKTILEAITIGNSIRSLLEQNYSIFDKKSGTYRQVTYRDIVILHRSPKQFAPKLIETLSGMGIPAYAGFSTGYFTTVEVLTVMNLLRIIDNPDQDIPLASVLRSPLVGLSDDDLANVRLAFEKGSFYMAMKQYMKGVLEDGNMDDPVFDKLTVFRERLERWQNQSRFLRIDRLLTDILDETNYLLFLSLEKDGHKKVENIHLLINRAISYGDTSFQGIFNFIKYVDYMERYDIELDEASTMSEYDNVVRVMSIHKSKGLEFPVVFLAGMSKQFNTRDLKETLIVHQDLGIGGEYVNIDKRYRLSTLKKEIIKAVQKKEMLEEELRILYVAMTRAREKLYMVGTVQDLEKASESWQEGQLTIHHLLKAMSYQDWVMPVLYRDQRFIELKSRDGILKDMVKQIGLKQSVFEAKKDPKVDEILNYQYPYQALTALKINRSVSELKKLKSKAFMDDEHIRPPEFETVSDFFEPTLPRFKSKTSEVEEVSGSARGTAYHQFFYHMDIHMDINYDKIEDIKRELLQSGLMDQKSIDLIDNDKIMRLLKQPLWKQVKSAKQVFKEAPFVLGENPSLFGVSGAEDRFVMVQGVVDLYFVGEDGLTIIDYKTDRIKKGQESVLINRYEEQLAIYGEALSRAYNLPVSHKYLYAMTLDQFIEV